MIYSILNDCLLLRNGNEQDLHNYFKKTGVTIFDSIFQKHKGEAKHIILFILCGYSEDSPLLILRQDSTEEKQAICDYLEIPDYKRVSLFKLGDKEVKKAVTTYLEQFAGYEFKTLMWLKMQLEDMKRDVTNREFSTTKVKEGKKEGEPDEITYYYDIKEHSKAIRECRQLATEIEHMEKSIKSKTKYLGIDNMAEWLTKSKRKQSTAIATTSGGSSLENSELIK